MMKRVKLNEEMMTEVNGGTFNNNTFETSVYNSVGIEVKEHFFEADEFFLPDGTKTDMHGADDFVASKLGAEKFNELAQVTWFTF